MPLARPPRRPPCRPPSFAAAALTAPAQPHAPPFAAALAAPFAAPSLGRQAAPVPAPAALVSLRLHLLLGNLVDDLLGYPQVLDRVPADVALGELPKSVAVPGRADNVLRWGKERGGGERNADGSNNKGRETERAGK